MLLKENLDIAYGSFQRDNLVVVFPGDQILNITIFVERRKALMLSKTKIITSNKSVTTEVAWD
jgi:hypothetical protein